MLGLQSNVTNVLHQGSILKYFSPIQSQRLTKKSQILYTGLYNLALVRTEPLDRLIYLLSDLLTTTVLCPCRVSCNGHGFTIAASTVYPLL